MVKLVRFLKKILTTEENLPRLTNLKQLSFIINKSFKNQIKSELGKLLQLIDHQMEQIQNETEQKESKLKVRNQKLQQGNSNSIKKLYRKLQLQYTKTTNLQGKDLALIQLTQESIESQSKSQSFIQIMESINLIRSSESINQSANISQIPTKEFDQHKTPCLNQICKQVQKRNSYAKYQLQPTQIWSISLRGMYSRISNIIHQLKRSEQYVEYLYWIIRRSISKQNCRNEKMFKLVIEEIKQQNDYYNHSLSEMISSINEQFVKNNQENKQIFELDEKSVEMMFDSLIKHDLLCKQQFMVILQEQQNNKKIGNNVQVDIKISPEINEFMSKVSFRSNTQKYLLNQPIFKKHYGKKHLNLSKMVFFNNLLCWKKKRTEDSQCFLFQQQYKQFEINSEKMRKLMEIGNNYKQNQKLQIKIDEEKQKLKKFKKKLLGQKKISIRYSQSDLKEREKSSIISDNLESLKNIIKTLLIKVDQKVEKLNETIKKIDNQQSIQTQQQKKVLISKINGETLFPSRFVAKDKTESQ